MIKDIFDHIPQFSLSKKNAVLDQNIYYKNIQNFMTSMLQIAEGIQNLKQHPDNWTF